MVRLKNDGVLKTHFENSGFYLALYWHELSLFIQRSIPGKFQDRNSATGQRVFQKILIAGLGPWLLFLYWYDQSAWLQHLYWVAMDNRISLDFFLVCQERGCKNINESIHGWINDSGQMKKSIQKLKDRVNWVCKLYVGCLWGLLGWLGLRLWGLGLMQYWMLTLS